MTNAGTVITDGDLQGSASDGLRAFLYGSLDSDNAKKGFNDTRVWTVYTKFAVAKAAFANGSLTWGTGAPVTAATAKFTGPTTAIADKGGYVSSAGFKVTNSIVYQPAATTDFFTNGLLYSAAIQTLDQNTPSALAGIAWIKNTGASTDSFVESSVVNTSLKATVTNLAPQVDGLATDSFDFVSNSGMSLVDTLSSANSMVMAAKVGTAGQFLITVTH